MIKKICQSCGTKIKKVENRGTEKNGLKSDNYCFKCYIKGDFIDKDLTLLDMTTTIYTQMTLERKVPKIIAKLAVKKIQKLKRWEKDKTSIHKLF